MRSPSTPSAQMPTCSDRVKGTFDLYGLSTAPSAKYQPTSGPKTWAGTFFSIIAMGIVGALWGVYAYAWIRTDGGAYSNVLGDTGEWDTGVLRLL